MSDGLAINGSVTASRRRFLGGGAATAAGLMFAGITDTCMMAMLLAKLPYNQPKTAPPQTRLQS